MATQLKKYPVPSFFDSDNGNDWGYRPNMRAVFEAAADYAREHEIKASATDASQIAWLGIDWQRDFCFPEGTLYVAGKDVSGAVINTGAVEDAKRSAQFLYENIGRITAAHFTMDTHFAFQIFTPSFWLDQDGRHLQPHDVVDGDMNITRLGSVVGKAEVNPAMVWTVPEDVAAGRFQWLQDYARHYCQELDKSGKYNLYIWPEHYQIGDDGHALTPIVHEARMFHAWVRRQHNFTEVKGGVLLSENYSVLSPEVLTAHDGRAIGQKNTRFIQQLLRYDALIVDGQAGSHCVKSTMDDLETEIAAIDKTLAEKVYIVRNHTSAVTVPHPVNKGEFIVDFTPQMEEAFDKWEGMGMNLVDSTTPMEEWPGVIREKLSA